jgi:cytochrome c-type biogenesis protein CcmF
LGFLAAIHVSIFAAIYAAVANAGYIWLELRGKLKAAGASVAHIGFALFLLGVIISSAKKELLSINTTGIALFAKTEQQDPAENITLIKGIRTDMGKYHVTYIRDTVNNFDRKKYFELKFENKNSDEIFYLYPDVLKNNKGQEGFSPNPDKRHYWNADIFAYVTSWLDASRNDTASFTPASIKAGDTVFYSNGLIVLNKVLINPAESKHEIFPGETAMLLDMTVVSKEGIHYSILPGIALKENTLRNIPDTVIAQNLVVKFNKVNDEKHGLLEIGIKENRMLNDLMTLKVYRFPFIFLVWIGIIVMVTGFVMSIVQRAKKKVRLLKQQT